jgi:DNA modification methylase
MSATVFIGDNLSIITEQIKNKSIDLIYFNPPFATTKNSWDSKLDWKELFKQFYRVLKDDGVIIIHCSVPFNYTIIRESPTPPNYTWYWKKENSTNPLLAKYQPLRIIEEILVWTNKKKRYFPQRVGNQIRNFKQGTMNTTYYNGTKKSPIKQNVNGYLQNHLIEMKRDIDGFSTRPHDLIKLIINSYTQENDTILDPTCYQGLCGMIAKQMNRKYIGIDKNFYPIKLMK